MPDVLIYADTVRSPELRHEVPVAIGDPFVYVERNGSRRVFVTSFEIPRLTGIEALHVEPLEELGLDELVAAGLPRRQVDRELVLRACRHVGAEAVVVPPSFPLAEADHLRANGIAVESDGEFFDTRRRSKTPAEIEGVRRAQDACERAMTAVREELRGGEDLTCERLRSRVIRLFTDVGMLVPDHPIVSHGAQTAVGHDPGSGAIAEGEPIVVDLYPQDPASGCYADMTRTFCLGEPPAELVAYHGLCRRALELACEAIRPGVRGVELHALVCELFESHGYSTQRTKAPGTVLAEGFYHSLGHGVGLDVHEQPTLGLLGRDELVPGDVLAVEPGLYRPGFGGCRLENLVLVTEDGAEVLTDYPYDLTP